MPSNRVNRFSLNSQSKIFEFWNVVSKINIISQFRRGDLQNKNTNIFDIPISERKNYESYISRNQQEALSWNCMQIGAGLAYVFGVIAR